MPIFGSNFSFPLFDRKRIIPFIPIKVRTAIGCGGSQGRPACYDRDCRPTWADGRRGSALPWTAAKPMARWAKTRWRWGFVAAVVLYLAITSAVDVHAEYLASGVSAADATESDDHAAVIEEAARRFDLPPALLSAVIASESGGNIAAVSPKGALGLMQLMPETYGDMQQSFGLGADPFDVHDNIIAGTAYLRAMLDRFGEDGFLAAYHAGPMRFERHLADGFPLPEETRKYLARLEPLITKFSLEREDRSPSTTLWASAPLFVVLSNWDALDATSTTAPPFDPRLKPGLGRAGSAAGLLFPGSGTVQ